MKIEEQERVLNNDKQNMLVSASAGSGKTYIMIKYICNLICEQHVPVKELVVLTFTKAAATEMKDRLEKRLKEQPIDDYIIEQLDALSTANISTIHSFCEKCIKKYANLLKLNENFEIADDNLSQKIRQTAFDSAVERFEYEEREDFLFLMAQYKNNKIKLRDILFEIEKLVNSVSEKEVFLEENVSNFTSFFDKSVNFLFDLIKKSLKELLCEVEKQHVADFEEKLVKVLSPILQSENLFKLADEVEAVKLPSIPDKNLIGEDVALNLKNIKEDISKLLKKVGLLQLTNENVVAAEREGKLEKAILKLFDFYEKEQILIKNAQNCLDFYDLEKYMKILSKNQDLFSGIKYVFVDEYQDTNKVQERIVKNVAKNRNFVAVGDVKQGIYGFRLASSEIFMKDMQDFEDDENSTVKYLKSNFRSCKNVLKFINDVFKVCMTKESCGVDYENTSMLEGVATFADDGRKSVNMDLVKKQPTEIEELPKLYSVKNAKVFHENFNLNLLLAIKNRIFEVLGSQIADGETLRPCSFGDIAILSRKRDTNFNNLELFLQQSGIPVFANSRNNLTDEVQIKILINYLKVALNMDDEIALMSVLISDLTDLSLEQLAQQKEKYNKNLCEIVQENESGIFENFNQNLQKFRKNCVVYGIKEAFEKLFSQTDFLCYINMKPNANKINCFISKFLSMIVESGFEFDLPSLIDYFENVEISVSSEGAQTSDCVLLTTIHNSKGLEYPIVFLIGCDASLTKNSGSDVEIDEKFGLALKYFDEENNSEILSVKMLAIREAGKIKSFCEELMIFYVALTRAKNRLYLFGEYDESIFKRYSISDCDSYFDLIFFALPKLKEALLGGDFYEDELLCARILDKVEEQNSFERQKIDGIVETDDTEKIEEYLSFKYPFDRQTNFNLKEGVTSLTNKNKEDKLEKYANDSFSFSSATTEEGNAYHLALKVLDFDKISTLADLKEQLALNEQVLSSCIPLLDENLLLENILIVKNLTQGAVIFKEKPFIMKEKLNNLIDDCAFSDEILVQGVVDLFAIKDGKVTLLDYKYSSSKNDEYLISHYKNQLKLYKIAIENATKMPVFACFLLSLKSKKLIKVEI